MKISKKIPIPEETRGRKRKYDFGNMSVGDSFPISSENRCNVYKSLKLYNEANKTSYKIKTSTDSKGDLRVWRVE